MWLHIFQDKETIREKGGAGGQIAKRVLELI